LQQAKHAFPSVYLIVGVCGDSDTLKYKGKTVMTEQQRAESVRHCRWVDEVVVGPPWILNQEFLDEYSIDFVAHDAEPYVSASSNDVYAFVKKLGRFRATQRTEGISTSDLINNIVSDYDDFVRRNLNRGYTRESMNVGFFKAQTLQIEDRMKKVGEKVGKSFGKMGDRVKNRIERVERKIDKVSETVDSKVDRFVDKVDKTIDEWVANSRRAISGFLHTFNRNRVFTRSVSSNRLTSTAVESADATSSNGDKRKRRKVETTPVAQSE
jgi:choline-phosphate cytidylyltransferase